MTNAPPVVPVFAAGYGYSPSQMDALIQEPFTFLTTGIVLRAVQETSQSISSSTWTTIEYGTVLEDPYSGWTGSPDYYWTTPYGGWYQVAATANITADALIMGMAAWFDNATRIVGCQNLMTGGTFGGNTVYTQYYLPPGATIAAQIWINGSDSTSVSAAGRYPSLEILFVSQ